MRQTGRIRKSFDSMIDAADRRRAAKLGLTVEELLARDREECDRYWLENYGRLPDRD